MRFIKDKHVREHVKEISGGSKQVSTEFLLTLDAYIQNIIERSVRVHNGGHKRLDAATARFVGATIRK